MSTGILYHAWNVSGYDYQRTEYIGGQVLFHIAQQTKWRCSQCSSSNVIGRGCSVRYFRTLPIGRKQVKLVLPVQRVQCLACGRIRQVKVEFADERRSYTKAFERYVLELSRLTTIKHVAEHLDVSWDLVKDIQKRDLQKHYGKPYLKHLRVLGIDEICVGKGRFLTLVLDLESGAVVFIGEGRSAESLSPFWKRLNWARARIEAVALDMSASYIWAVNTHLPNAKIVFDHFHVIKLFNEKISDLRRAMYREAVDNLHKEVLKGTRWLLLKNPENLDPTKNERQRLDEALRMNQPLATVYYLKEELRHFWMQPDKAAAQRFLSDWLYRAWSAGIPRLKKFANLLASKRWGLLAYYDFKISTGPLEGTNNKIRTMQRQAYGYRDDEFFKLKIYALHRVKYALIG